MPAKPRTAKSSARKSPTPAPEKAPKLSWLELPDEELAAHLLARPTIPDGSWSSRSGGKVREKGETRAAFIARVLGSSE